MPHATRRTRVLSCLGEVTQQIHSFRASGVMSCHAASAAGAARKADARSSGSSCTTPPGRVAALVTPHGRANRRARQEMESAAIVIACLGEWKLPSRRLRHRLVSSGSFCWPCLSPSFRASSLRCLHLPIGRSSRFFKLAATRRATDPEALPVLSFALPHEMLACFANPIISPP